jgi:3-isopropylmalate/(R)-2-methylmalate dehydratase small subunit
VTVSAVSAPSFTTLTSRVVVLPEANIDTDQIIPARYLKITDKLGLADGLFADWRVRADFPIGKPAAAGAQILLAGDNFGCGSSREHAPWALVAGGFRAVVSTSFADIFRGNALKNGLLPVPVDAATHATLFAAVAADPALTLTIDLEAQTLRHPGGVVRFPVDGFARTCLLGGVDELGYLLKLEPAIAAHEARVEASVAASLEPSPTVRSAGQAVRA